MKYSELTRLLKGEKRAEKIILAEEILKIKKQELLISPEKEFEEKELLEAFSRLENSEPMQYILGKWEFMGREYQVGEGVLIPREDTACVVELSIEMAENPQTFVDLGSGSGCIAVTLAESLNISGYAIERSEKAFRYLEQNIKMTNGKIEAVLSDMFSDELIESLPPLDIVISNPPYITEDEMKELSKEVLREPHEALFGGLDGLDYYKKIIENYTPLLKKGGIMAFEVGFRQADSVIELFRGAGFKDIKEKTDFSNIRRAVCARK